MTDSLIIFANRLIDGTGGHIRKDVLLEVNNGLISALKDSPDFDPNGPDTRVLSTGTIIPGLIDSHVHLFMSGTSDQVIRQQQLDATFEGIKDVILKHLKQQLAHGIIAVRDGGDYAGHTLRYKKEILPSIDLPIILRSAGKAWHARGRYGKLIGSPPLEENTLAQSIAKDNTNIDHLKVVNSGLNSLTEFGKITQPQFSLDQLKSAFQTAVDLGLRVMVHANGELPVRLAIEAGCHSIEHGFFMGRDNLKKMAEKQITWVPTACTMKAYHDTLDSGSREKDISLKNLDHQLEQISLAIEYDVPIAVGTDCGSLGVHHGSALKDELGLLMQAGMSLEKVVRCATRNGAKALGLEDGFGILAVGMPATFVAVKEDPSFIPKSLDKPERIYVNGKAYTRENNFPQSPDIRLLD